MPEKDFFKLNVIAESPLAAVFGAEQLEAEALIKKLLDQELAVIAVSQQLKSISNSLNKQLLTIEYSSWQKILSDKPVSYIVDFNQDKKVLNFAKRKGIRYLRILKPTDDLNSNQEILEKNNFDWRLVQAGQVYGVKENWQQKTPLDHLFLAAVFNLQPEIEQPDKEIFPIEAQDLAEGLFLSLISPAASRQALILAGNPISIKEIWQTISQEAQVKSDKIYPERIGEFGNLDFKKISNSHQILEWQPPTELKTAIINTIRHLFQKLEKEQLTPAIPKAPPAPTKIKTTKKIPTPPKKQIIKRQPVSVIIEQDLGIKETPKTVSPPNLKNFVQVKKEKIELPKKEVKPVSLEKQPKAEKNFWRFWWTPILTIIGLYFFPLFFVILNLGMAGFKLKSAVESWQKNDFSKAEKQALQAQKATLRGKNFILKIDSPFFYFNQEEKLLIWLDSLEKASWLTSTATGWIITSDKIVNFIFDKQNFDNRLLANLKNESEKLISEFSLAKAYFNQAAKTLPSALQIKTQPYQKTLDEYQENLINLLPAIEIFSWISNQAEPLRLLVLLQNNAELRPGGGFIGSFAILTFDQGQLVEFNVQDVYSADGQLKGYVEPPKPIKEIVGEQGWYLRDSNWSPDFPTNAKTATWFLEKSIGIKPDGVIGFTLEAAKNLLGAIGEVYLPDFNEKIVAENLFAKAEFYSEKNFFPGSNQKASFLSSLFQQLLINFEEGNFNQSAVGQAILRSLNQKEITLYLDSEQINRILKDQNWTGEIKKISPADGQTFTDYLYINEANVGVNKANYFLKRSIEKMVKIQSHGKIDHILKINYENTAKTDNWPAGNYKNYLRILVPQNTKIEQITIFGSQQKERKTLDWEKVDQEKIEDKQSFGFLVDVPIDSRITVEVSYSQTTNLGKNFWRWLLYWQKQSGFGKTPVTLLISYPDQFKPLQVNPQATLTPQGIIFNQTLEKDLLFGVELGQ